MTSPEHIPDPNHKQDAPATARNRDPILAVLRRVLPPAGTVLEVASGTGQHAVAFAQALPTLRWQPTDPDAAARASIRAWAAEAALANLLPPLALDAQAWPWPVSDADAVVSINMVHIAPWEACQGLMHGAGVILGSGARLVLYGPYKVGGAHTAPSNQDFDDWLKARDPRLGVRDLEAVSAEAASHRLTLIETVAMPANNLVLVFQKA